MTRISTRSTYDDDASTVRQMLIPRLNAAIANADAVWAEQASGWLDDAINNEWLDEIRLEDWADAAAATVGI